MASSTIVKGDKEFIFNLFLKERPQILHTVLNMDLDNILLERYYEGLKLDLYSLDKKLGREILMETWLGQSNQYHQDKILKILTVMNEGTVVYLCINFQTKHVNQLKEHVIQLGKPVQLFFVQINPDIIHELADLDRQNALLIYEHLYWLNNVPKVLQVVDHVAHPYYQDLRPKNIKPTPSPDLTTREGINQQLLQELRRQIPEFLVFHREKHQMDLRILNFGGGMAGVGFFLSTEDRYNRAFLELRFEQDKADWYQHFARNQEYYRREMGDQLEFHKNARIIGYYFKPYANPLVTINELVRVFRDFLEFFTFYLELGRALVQNKEKKGE